MTARKTRAVEPDEIDLDDVNSDYYVEGEPDEELEVDADYEDEIEPEPEPAARPRKRPAAKKSRIPANAPRPQDRQRKAAKKAPAKKAAAKRAPAKRTAAKRTAPRPAVQVEAEDDEFIEIEHDGLVISIPADVQEWSIEATYAFEQGNAVTAVRELVGERDFAEIRAKRYTNRQFGELFEKIADEGGFATSGN